MLSHIYHDHGKRTRDEHSPRIQELEVIYRGDERVPRQQETDTQEQEYPIGHFALTLLHNVMSQVLSLHNENAGREQTRLSLPPTHKYHVL